MPTYTLLTPRDLETIAEAFAGAPAVPTKAKALNTIARAVAGPRHDWGRITNATENTFLSQRASAQQRKDAPTPPPNSDAPGDLVDPAATLHTIVAQSMSSSSYDGRFPSGVADREPSPDVALCINDGPVLNAKAPISACTMRCLDDLAKALPTTFEGRAVTTRQVQVNNLSPRDITGHTLPLFFDLQSHMHASATPKPRLGMLDFDTIPVLGFVEDAWSETLKAVDKELSGRYARWEWERYRFPHRTGSSSADGFTTKPPHAVFYVENHARFVDVIRRFMPFTHAALAVQ